MKKLLLFAAMLTFGWASAADCQDGPYGLKINGSTVVDAPKFGDPDMENRVQYKAACVSLKVGDEVQLLNQSCDATWMVDIDPYGAYQNFEGGKAVNKITCKVAGIYDFYIKLSAEKGDVLYIGDAQDCGDQGGGGDQGGTKPTGGNPRYYYKMYTPADEKWYEPSQSTLFDHGVAEMVEFQGTDAYVFVLYQVDGQGGVQYRTEEYKDDSFRHVRLVLEGPKDWKLPAGTTNLYLYDNEDGSLELSVDPMPGKKLADPQPQGFEHVTATDKAHKVFIGGQLRIIRGDRMYDATGREL